MRATTLKATLALALAGTAGCKTSIPRCGADVLPTEEQQPSHGFLLVPQVRTEAVNIFESQWSAITVSPELYFGGTAAGATVGYANMAGSSGFVMGASILRYVSAPRLFASNGWVGSLTLPDVNGRMYFMSSDEDPVLWASLTTDVTGFRVARCLGHAACFHATLRGPTVGPAILFMDPYEVKPGDVPLGALILGGAADVGFAF